MVDEITWYMGTDAHKGTTLLYTTEHARMPRYFVILHYRFLLLRKQDTRTHISKPNEGIASLNVVDDEVDERVQMNTTQPFSVFAETWPTTTPLTFSTGQLAGIGSMVIQTVLFVFFVLHVTRSWTLKPGMFTYILGVVAICLSVMNQMKKFDTTIAIEFLLFSVETEITTFRYKSVHPYMDEVPPVYALCHQLADASPGEG